MKNPSEQNTDIQLLDKYFEGDEAAFTFLVGRYIDPIYNFVFKYVHTTAEADDVTQEAFVKIWKNIKKYDRNYKFKTWAFTIAKNTALDHLRKKSLIPFSDFQNAEGIFDHSLLTRELISDNAIEKIEDMQMIARAVKSLPEKYKEVVSLYYDKELNFREISEFLKQSINTVKTRHRRAISYLKRQLLGK